MFRFLLNAYIGVKNWLLELLFPTRCAGCQKISVLLCEACSTTVPYRNTPQIAPDIYAAVAYRHPITEQLIWALKYKGDRRAAGYLAEMVWESCGEIISDIQALETEPVVITGIPSYAGRMRPRALNHTDILIHRLRGQYLDNKRLLFVPGMIKKVRDTAAQMKLSREERLRNLVGTFTVPRTETVEGSIVFVFDDVTTTGATFTEARRALLEAGAKNVLCFAVAH